MAKGSDPKPKEKTPADKTPTDKAPADDAADKKPVDGTDDDKSKFKEKTFTKAELENMVTKAVADAKKKWDDEKDLEESERLKLENDDLRAQIRLRDAKDEVVAALAKENAQSPELLWKTLQGDLEFDDAGKVKNLDTLVAGLKTDYAEMFGEKKPDGTIDGGKGQKGDETSLTLDKIKAMSTEEVAENLEEVHKVLAKQAS